MLSVHSNSVNSAGVLHLLQQCCPTVLAEQLKEPRLQRLGTRHGIGFIWIIQLNLNAKLVMR